MTRKQRAAPQSAPPKGQTAPSTRQHLAKGDESTVAAKRRTAQELQRPNAYASVARRHMEVGRGEGEI